MHRTPRSVRRPAQVAVPSREDNEMYQVVRTAVDQLVGRINGQHSTIGFVPVLPPPTLCCAASST
jgi:trehalose-6-phosphate synthase